jgi:pimeloyl-ACP methyl ester carboxylesterase
MRSEHVDFEGSRGARLAARLDLPDKGPVRAYAVFAHCFTCNKDIKAPVAIGRALAEAGIATFRFDFTGLGGSEGDFGETTFTSNIDDLLNAARYVGETFGSVQLMIGHSLGGAAALRAAALLDGVRAAVTIGAPYRPHHVLHHLAADLERIEREGIAEIVLAGRPVRVGREFVRDITEHSAEGTLKSFDKPLLVMHAPQDETVPLDEARKLFEAARHPKSFVALGGADHLLSSSSDGQYVGQLIAVWCYRYLSDR